MSLRTRLAVFAAVLVLAVAGTAAFVLRLREQRREQVAAAPPVPVADLAAVTRQPHVVFRSTAIGDEYGRVAAVPLTDPTGPRAFTQASCDRVYAHAGEAVCLYAKPGFVTTYRAEVLDAGWAIRRSLPLSGVPSRTRLSPDGEWAATTTFVSGHAYSSPGDFSTETLITPLTGGGRSLNLESDFTLVVDGRRNTARDRNMWGVTFAADGDRFYATAASGDRTWLVRGSLSSRELVALREDAECPSLSPDGGRVAFKTRDGRPEGQWMIAVYDLATGRSTLLAEKHSVDDQIEWLDGEHVLYGLPRAGNGPSASDVWTVPADGTGAPRLFVPDAWSPAVVR
ncbi:PD40 domain-containing protein [Actinoplanes teichomyceticus]|uniref:WD40 repeat protein n=1 Tax=Actinoplanes teichomyceticus TaxID=1867 RepID=A0A561VLA2_ACTTI|nr:PD40 domain-containing protein [Actinoplanes teichomyceticus]TWG12403.1 WD40 repeat protein [Actinoplanes teichomyceticus]GIF13763.1 TolB-like translocation protein; signal peptide [Actinoplanes teichomyceticus]